MLNKPMFPLLFYPNAKMAPCWLRFGTTWMLRGKAASPCLVTSLILVWTCPSAEREQLLQYLSCTQRGMEIQKRRGGIVSKIQVRKNEGNLLASSTKQDCKILTWIMKRTQLLNLNWADREELHVHSWPQKSFYCTRATEYFPHVSPNS